MNLAAVTRATALGAVLAVLAGCASPAKKQAPPPAGSREAARAQIEQGIDPMKLQSGLLALGDTAVQRVAGATAFEGQKLDVDTRQRLMQSRLALSSAVFGIVTGPDQVDALADILTHTALVAEAQRNAAKGAKPGAPDDRLRVALDRNEADAWALAKQWLPEEALARLRERIAALPLERDSPLKVAYVRLADLPRAGSESIDSGDGLTDTLRAAAQQADQVRLLAERSLFLMQRMPFLMRWQAQAYSYDALALDETQKLLEQLGDLSEATAAAARTAAALPGSVSKERQAALEDLFSRIRIEREATLKQLAEAIREERSAALVQASQVVDAQRQATFKDVAQLVDDAETRGTRVTGIVIGFIGLLIVLLLGLLLIYRRLSLKILEHAQRRPPAASPPG